MKSIYYLYFLLLVSPQMVLSQVKRSDTIINYHPSTSTYTFYFKSPSQKFFWDSIEHIPSDIRFKIINNTGSAIQIKRVGGGDGALLFYSKFGGNNFHLNPPDYAVLMPDSFLLVQPKMYSKRPYFKKPLSIRYATQKEIKTLQILNWGYIPSLIEKYATAIVPKQKEQRKIGNQSEKLIDKLCPKDTFDIRLRQSSLPHFVGGDSALLHFLKQNFNQQLIDKVGIEGRIYISFVVSADGSLKRFEILRSLHPLLDQELYRVLKSSPKWKSAVCCPPDMGWYESESQIKSLSPCCFCSKKYIVPFKVQLSQAKR